MRTRILGNSDMAITPIGFGAWAIGGSGWQYGWGAQSQPQALEAIRRALELGINWIDTAAVYGLGVSEELVGRALREWRGPRPYVFTKCGRVWNERREIGYSLRAESIRRECEGSLRRLGVEVIDLYQIHWPTNEVAETEEGWRTLIELKQEGKIRWAGVSNFSLQEMKRAQSIAPVTSLQPPYSLVRRNAEQELLPFCQREGIGVIVYSPMASGLLTGAMTRERAQNLPPDDWRSRDPEFQEPKLSRSLALVERLRKVAAQYGRTPGEAAIAWTLRHPAVTGAIVGARSGKQVEGVIGALEWRLTAQEIQEIEGNLWRA